MTGHREKRRHKRVALESQVAVLHDGQFNFEKALQLSEGGMLIQAQREYAAGDVVEVCFFISHTEYVGTKAEIIYRLDQKTGGDCFGLRFIDPSAEALEAIRRYSASQSSV